MGRHDMMTNTNTITNEMFSKEDQIYNNITIKGLNTRFTLNVKDYDIFILKELFIGLINNKVLPIYYLKILIFYKSVYL